MQSVDRIVKLIDLLGSKQEGMPISQISRQLGLSGSTVHRILTSLKNHRIVDQDEVSKRYHLGLKILSWSGQLINNNQVRNVAYNPIRELSTRFQACVFLSVIENGKTICIDTVSNIKGNINFYVKVGSFMPLNAAAASQAIVAFMPPALIEDMIEREKIQSYTDKTICTVKSLKERINHVRASGYAVCDEELDRGVVAIAVPLFDFTNSVVGSISSCDIKNSDEIHNIRLKELKETAMNISLTLGATSQSVLDFFK